MYTLHVISLKFTGNPCKISPKISLLHGFPTSNAGNPHSIPVKQIPCKYYNGNQSVDISKLQGLQVYMQSPWWLHACYREHFATQGFPALFMGKTFAVHWRKNLTLVVLALRHQPVAKPFVSALKKGFPVVFLQPFSRDIAEKL